MNVKRKASDAYNRHNQMIKQVFLNIKQFIFESFASSIIQELYETEKTLNKCDDITVTIDQCDETQECNQFILKLMKKKSNDLLQSSTYLYDVFPFPKEVIIEILEYAYDLHQSVGSELLHKHFNLPIVHKISFIPYIIQRVYTMNLFILLITLLIYNFFFLSYSIEPTYVLYYGSCSMYQYIISHIMYMQYALSVFEILLHDIIFCIMVSMPLKSFLKWRRYYTLYRFRYYNLPLYHKVKSLTIDYDFETMKLLLFPYQQLTIFGGHSLPNEIASSTVGFPWIRFIKSYHCFVFYLYVSCLLSIEYDMGSNRLSQVPYQFFVFILYLLPIIFTLFALNEISIKQRMKRIWNRWYYLPSTITGEIQFVLRCLTLGLLCLAALLCAIQGTLFCAIKAPSVSALIHPLMFAFYSINQLGTKLILCDFLFGPHSFYIQIEKNSSVFYYLCIVLHLIMFVWWVVYR